MCIAFTSFCLNSRLRIAGSTCGDDVVDGRHSTTECRKNIFRGMGRMLLVSLGEMVNRKPSTMPAHNACTRKK